MGGSQVITGLGTTESLFEALVQTSFVNALATAGGVDKSEVEVVNILERSRSDSLLKRNSGSPAADPSPATSGDGEVDNILEVVCLIHGSQTGLLSVQASIESNWEDVMVARMRSIGIEVMAARISIVSLDNPRSKNEDVRYQAKFELCSRPKSILTIGHLFDLG